MSKIRRQAGVLFIGILFMFSSAQQVWADNSPASVVAEEANSKEAAPVSEIEKVKDSIVQVVLEYVDPQGNPYILKSGSGFLINTGVVLTSYDLLALNEQEIAEAQNYLGTVLGKPVSFNGAEGTMQVSCQIGVVMYRDVVVTAEVNNYSSKEMNLGILNLSSSMDKGTVILGNSAALGTGDTVYALGYKNVSVMQPGKTTELLSQRDVKVTEGILNGSLSRSGAEYLGHTAKIKKGSTGGPIVDSEGNVIGMNVSGRAEDGSYISLSVNEIKQLLDSCKITYQESGLVSISQEDIADAREKKTDINVELLDDYILNYSLLEKSSYTNESYQLLEAALKNAREIKADKNATQEEVDAAVEQLVQAKAQLVTEKKINWPPIIITTVIVAAVIVGLVLYILKLKGILFQKPEPEPPLTLSQVNRFQQNKPEPQNIINVPNMSYNETTVLGMENQEEGTVVLRTSGSLPTAYLLRNSSQERIRLDALEFLIGKDKSRVNYCIADNPSVSRCHAKIRRQGTEYCLSDMKSTNLTYLNNRALMPGEERELTDGDRIRFSNEEFTFHEA